MNLLKNFAADESGATAIEYGLIAALISVVIIGAVGLLGGTLEDTFTTINDGLTGATTTEPTT
jgi:pilus assembly protein Flp/PilA